MKLHTININIQFKQTNQVNDKNIHHLVRFLYRCRILCKIFIIQKKVIISLVPLLKSDGSSILSHTLTQSDNHLKIVTFILRAGVF